MGMTAPGPEGGNLRHCVVETHYSQAIGSNNMNVRFWPVPADRSR